MVDNTALILVKWDNRIAASRGEHYWVIPRWDKKKVKYSWKLKENILLALLFAQLLFFQAKTLAALAATKDKQTTIAGFSLCIKANVYLIDKFHEKWWYSQQWNRVLSWNIFLWEALLGFGRLASSAPQRAFPKVKRPLLRDNICNKRYRNSRTGKILLKEY